MRVPGATRQNHTRTDLQCCRPLLHQLQELNELWSTLLSKLELLRELGSITQDFADTVEHLQLPCIASADGGLDRFGARSGCVERSAPDAGERAFSRSDEAAEQFMREAGAEVNDPMLDKILLLLRFLWEPNTLKEQRASRAGMLYFPSVS